MSTRSQLVLSEIKEVKEKADNIDIKTIDDLLRQKDGTLGKLKTFLNEKKDKKLIEHAFFMAAQLNQTDCLEYTLSLGMKVDTRGSDGKTALHLAAHKGHLPIIQFLLSQGAMLGLSCENDIEVIEGLDFSTHKQIVKKVKIKQTELDIALSQCYGEVVRYLKEANELSSPKSIEQLEERLSQGHTFFLRDSRGNTLLHHAVALEYTGMALFLLSNGLDLASRNLEGQTPISALKQKYSSQRGERTLQLLVDIFKFSRNKIISNKALEKSLKKTHLQALRHECNEIIDYLITHKLVQTHWVTFAEKVIESEKLKLDAHKKGDKKSSTEQKLSEEEKQKLEQKNREEQLLLEKQLGELGYAIWMKNVKCTELSNGLLRFTVDPFQDIADEMDASIDPKESKESKELKENADIKESADINETEEERLQRLKHALNFLLKGKCYVDADKVLQLITSGDKEYSRRWAAREYSEGNSLTSMIENIDENYFQNVRTNLSVDKHLLTSHKKKQDGVQQEVKKSKETVPQDCLNGQCKDPDFCRHWLKQDLLAKNPKNALDSFINSHSKVQDILQKVLFCVVQWDMIELASYMLTIMSTKDISVDYRDNKQRTALILAAEYASPDMIMLLIKAKADYKAEIKVGSFAFTVTMCAARGGRNENIEALLDVDKELLHSNSSSGHNVCMAAAFGGQQHTIDYLKLFDSTFPQRMSNNGFSMYMAAAAGGQLGIMDEIEKTNPDIYRHTLENHYNVYMIAIEFNHLHIVKYLNYKFSFWKVVTPCGDTAATVAAEHGRIEILWDLYQTEIEHHDNFRNIECFPITHTGIKGTPPPCKSVFVAAHKGGHTDIIDFLNEENENSQHSEYRGYGYSQRKHYEYYDYRTHDFNNYSYVMIAAQHGQLRKFFNGWQNSRSCPWLESTTCENNDNVFLMTVESGDFDMVKKLLAFHPEFLNKPCAMGYTPLIVAAWYGHTQLVEFFLNLDVGALNKSTKRGRSAYILAASNGHVPVMKLLEKHDEQLWATTYTSEDTKPKRIWERTYKDDKNGLVDVFSRAASSHKWRVLAYLLREVDPEQKSSITREFWKKSIVDTAHRDPIEDVIGFNGCVQIDSEKVLLAELIFNGIIKCVNPDKSDHKKVEFEIIKQKKSQQEHLSLDSLDTETKETKESKELKETKASKEKTETIETPEDCSIRLKYTIRYAIEGKEFEWALRLLYSRLNLPELVLTIPRLLNASDMAIALACQLSKINRLDKETLDPKPLLPASMLPAYQLAVTGAATAAAASTAGATAQQVTQQQNASKQPSASAFGGVVGL